MSICSSKPKTLGVKFLLLLKVRRSLCRAVGGFENPWGRLVSPRIAGMPKSEVAIVPSAPSVPTALSLCKKPKRRRVLCQHQLRYGALVQCIRALNFFSSSAQIATKIVCCYYLLLILVLFLVLKCMPFSHLKRGKRVSSLNSHTHDGTKFQCHSGVIYLCNIVH